MRRTIIALTYGLEGYVLLIGALPLLRPDFATGHHSIATARYAFFLPVLLFLLAAYIVAVIRNRGMTPFEKTCWIAGFVVGWPFVLTFYWHRHMTQTSASHSRYPSS